MEIRISFQKQTNATFLLQNYDLWTISNGEKWNFTGASYVKSGNSLAPHNWAHTSFFTS